MLRKYFLVILLIIYMVIFAYFLDTYEIYRSLCCVVVTLTPPNTVCCVLYASCADLKCCTHPAARDHLRRDSFWSLSVSSHCLMITLYNVLSYLVEKPRPVSDIKRFPDCLHFTFQTNAEATCQAPQTLPLGFWWLSHQRDQ